VSVANDTQFAESCDATTSVMAAGVDQGLVFGPFGGEQRFAVELAAEDLIVG
jgi:hypothetical protein